MEIYRKAYKYIVLFEWIQLEKKGIKVKIIDKTKGTSIFIIRVSFPILCFIFAVTHSSTSYYYIILLHA